MRQVWRLFMLSALCSGVVFGAAIAAEPDHVEVGVLLPLTGPFAGVAETQKEGALLAVDVVNQRGGLDMPWGKVRVSAVVDDDEAKLDVGVRRYRYMVAQGVKGVGGQTWAPLAYAVNAMVSREAMTYFPLCVMSKEGYKKGKLADSTFATAYSPWSIGYMSGKSAIDVLGKRRIFFLARSDSFGWDMRDGVRAAAKQYGADVVGYDEVPLGTSDFTAILTKVQAAKPDIFVFAQFGADAVALLKQVHQMGLGKDMAVFNAFITNVVASGVPAEDLQGVYAMTYFYYDLGTFPDKDVAASARAFTDLFRAKYQSPPDAYAAIAYIAYTEMFRGFEAAKSFDPHKVAAALMANSGAFNTVKGPAQWREDHEPVYKYAAFLVRGKGPSERKDGWDLFTVIGSQGGQEVLPTPKALGY